MQAVVRKIVVLGTGGTIAGASPSADDLLGYTAAQLGIGQLLESVPELARLHIVAEQVAQIDSKDMGFEVWRQLALRCAHWLAREDVGGIVVTHGTDTLEETAYFLHSVLAPAKPVLLTGAMRPATAVEADGPRNLADALAVASAGAARGVAVVFAGRIHEAVHVAKIHSHRLDAFDSGEAGPLGQVADGAIVLDRGWPEAGDAQVLFGKVVRAQRWPRVEIVMNYAGAGGAMVRALVAQGVDGIIAAGTGNGSLGAEMEAALLVAAQAGVKVLRASRCAQGGVLAHAGDVLPGAGVLSAVKARVALWLALLPD